MKHRLILTFTLALGAGMGAWSLPLAAPAHAAPVADRQVQGLVRDALGRPLAGVVLQLEAMNGRIIATTRSDDTGHFVFPASPRGTYAILAKAPGYLPGTAIVTTTSAKNPLATVTLASKGSLTFQIVAKRIERGRTGVSKKTGTSVYHVSKQAIQHLAQGENTPINKVLLQAPGVAQDSFGQIHVEGEHGDVQYRINGIMLPAGISGFGHALDTRFAQSLDLLTGTLPARYGIETAGVVNIQTKSGAFQQGADLDLYGGAYNTLEPSVQWSGSKGPLDYYLTGSYVQDDLGIEAPTADPNPLHDHTSQGKGLGFFSYMLNPSLKASAILGSSLQHFQIPDIPGQTPSFNLAGVTSYPSANLNENQSEFNQYGILALQGTGGTRLDYQVALFTRTSDINYQPDPIGDLIYNGVAAQINRNDLSNGMQGDAGYKLNPFHTLRAGYYIDGEHAIQDNTSSVFPANAAGQQTSDVPITITDNSALDAWTYSAYLQDEWKALEKLTVNYGLRYDVLTGYVNANGLSPRLGMVYDVDPATTVHAGYARYFTPPSTELISQTDIQAFQNTTNALPTGVNASVLPARSNEYDLGVSHQVNDALTLGLDSYYKDVQDLLDEGQFGQALVFSDFNYAVGRIYGLVLSGNYHAGPLSTYLNLAYGVALGEGVVSGQYNFTQDELNFINSNFIHLDHDQTYTASGGASYDWWGTNIGLDAIYGSGLRQGFANTLSMPPYAQFDFGATRKLVLPYVGSLDARLSVINLFDQIYEIRNGTGIGVGAPQFGPQRALYLGVNKAF